MKNLSIYIKHPTCILDELKWKYRSYKFKFITSIKLRLYKYEYNKYFNEYVRAWRTNEMVYLTNYNPVIIVQRALEEYFKGNIYPRYLEAQIHGIVVGTQDTSKNTVTIYLRLPGLIIGPYGAHIDDLEKILTEKFGKKTEIKLVEMKSDINDWQLEELYESVR
jgi:hypothetical protein